MEIIVACYDVTELENAYKIIRSKQLKKYKSNQEKIINNIEDYLKNI